MFLRGQAQQRQAGPSIAQYFASTQKFQYESQRSSSWAINWAGSWCNNKEPRWMVSEQDAVY